MAAKDQGPVFLQDIHLIENLAKINREQIPERMLHAKGTGAHGYFRVYQGMAPVTKAQFLQDPEKKTPVLARFSTAVGSRGSPDSARDVRGFAVKFYTEDGNYDLLCSNLPVFFIRDAIKFPELIHSCKPAMKGNIQSSYQAISRFWDFISRTPESTHMITWVFSDRGTLKSYRTMEGFSVNTFVWVNKQGKGRYVRYYWKPGAGVETIDSTESTRLAGEDPHVAIRDLYDWIASGKSVEYELQVQMMEYGDELTLDFDPLDATLAWPEVKYPFTPVGLMVLDKNPVDFFAEIEQAAFSPVSLVPGIEPSADKILQGRLFSYADTQRHRLGLQYSRIPVNRPKCTVSSPRDREMVQPGDLGEMVCEAGFPSSGGDVSGDRFHRFHPPDNFRQAGERYRSLSTVERDHLVDNIIDSLRHVTAGIQLRVIQNFSQADGEFGELVKKGLDI